MIARPILLFGAGGQVGQALLRVAHQHSIKIVGHDRQSVDIEHQASVRDAVGHAAPSLIINAAAYTAVDKAEDEVERAFAVNKQAAAIVAEAAESAQVPLIHLSTDYVFDGKKNGAYHELDDISPLGAYGRSKADGEAAIRALCPRALIIRTAWVYGLEGNNFVKTMLRLGRERDRLRIVCDQHGCPTFADDLARGIFAIAGQLASQWGVYHLAGSGQTTWFEFARAIFALAASHMPKTPMLDPITSAEYPTRAVRPLNSVLDGGKAKRTFGIELPHWKDGLSQMLRAHFEAAPT